MAEVASEADLLNPANRAKVEQALSLIFKGKAGIAGQDPALRGITNALILKGARSAEQIYNAIQEQKQKEAREATAKRVQEAELARQQKQQAISQVANKIENQVDLSGKGRFVQAVNIGRGKAQDILFNFSQGRITSTRAIGKTLPISQVSVRKNIIPITSKAIQQSLSKSKTAQNIKIKALRGLDIITGGLLTERNLEKKQQQINQDITNFNSKYGGRELSEQEYAIAKSISNSIEKRESNLIKEKDKLATSTRSKIAGILSPLEKRRTSTEIQKQIETNKSKLKKEEANLEKIKNKIKIESQKKGIVAKINLKRLNNLKRTSELEIERLKTGARPKVLTGDLPLVPAYNIPSGVTSIKFIGTQKKGKDGKLITDIVFQTSKGEIGRAKAISVTKGKKTASAVLGRSGRVAFKFPTSKKKIINVRSFVGKETSVSKVSPLYKTAKIGDTGLIAKIKSNIQSFKQLGIGEVASVKGNKFIKPVIRFPSGKVSLVKSKGIDLDSFVSLSNILTKKDLSLIIGNSMTGAGAKSKFIGLIKGTSGATKFTVAEKAQFAKGLQKLISTTASALSRTKKVGGLTKSLSLLKTADIAVKIAKTKPTTKAKITTVKQKVSQPQPLKTLNIPQDKTLSVTKLKALTTKKVTSRTAQQQQQRQVQREIQKIKQIDRQLQRVKQRILQGNKQNLTQRQKLIQRQRILQINKQLQKLKLKLNVLNLYSIPRLIRKPPIISKKKKKKKKVAKKKTKENQGYVSSSRKKLNKIPITKSRALDILAYYLDKNPSIKGRTIKSIRKVNPKILKRSLKSIPKNYFMKNRRKFILRKIKSGRETYEMIERKKFRKDSRKEKIRRRKVTRRKKR